MNLASRWARHLRAAGCLTVLTLALGSAACAAPTTEEDTAADDEALRKLKEGDVDLLLTVVDAQSPPASMSEVKTWSVEYVHTKEANPADEFNGVAMYAKDASGEARYVVAVTTTDKGAELAFLRVLENGDSVALDLATDDPDPAKAERAQETMAWLGSESARILEDVRTNVATPASAESSTQSFGFAGNVALQALSKEQKDALLCTAKVAVFTLTTVATFSSGFGVAMLVQAGADLLFGEWSSAATDVAMAGTVTGVGKVLAKKGMQKTAKWLGRGSIAGVGALFVYTLATKKSMREVMETLVPEECIATYDFLTRSPNASVEVTQSK